MVFKEINQTAENVHKVSGFLDKVLAVFGGISAGVGKAIVFMNSIGMSNTEAYAVIAIIALLSFLGVLKFMKIITKLLIFGLVIFVLASLLGLL